MLYFLEPMTDPKEQGRPPFPENKFRGPITLMQRHDLESALHLLEMSIVDEETKMPDYQKIRETYDQIFQNVRESDRIQYVVAHDQNGHVIGIAGYQVPPEFDTSEFNKTTKVAQVVNLYVDPEKFNIEIEAALLKKL